ncbi:hypothetical protein EIN_047470 [Entamoeba invadens IP1]|uniref:Uncharacterized protein n=1 Tax=Entamoeba invadens IP1 TaxID=370355 RepID=A0A0A1UDC9_ENTIV|nr:hypothetical protein EIN_047470 [Entamoeba invadens IP1]ELP94454.1 hypothetical protein EIN_047470 [Entamoeba invadens IP1]|eukprot:XP_004261225.1 hypothetical protein EIN_047470 [Entamoeba invadens IP1]
MENTLFPSTTKTPSPSPFPQTPKVPESVSTSPHTYHFHTGSSIINENPGWDSTPYTDNGITIYLVILDSKGHFIAHFRPADFIMMKPMKHSGEFSWMKSYVYNTKIKQPLFPVACDGLGRIIDGVSKL